MNKGETDLLGDRWLSGQPVFLTDLSRFGPTSAMSDESRAGHWRPLEYDAEGLEGTMLLAGPETAAPDITYPLGVSGWHAMSFGVFGDGRNPVRFMVRLSSEKTFTLLTLPEGDKRSGGRITELFWKAADITGRELVLGQVTWQVAPGDGPGTRHCSNANVAYVKLTPMSEAEVAEFQADGVRTDTRTVFAHNDAHTVHFASRPTTPEEVRRHLEPYRGSDISRLYWEAGIGDLTFYFSKIGTIPTADGLDDLQRQGDRMLAESWRAFRDSDTDPFEIALDCAHEMGIEFHASYRVAGFHFPVPHDEFNFGTDFYKHNLHLRGKDWTGNPTPRIAYSYPETRRFVVSLLREMAQYPIDGVCLLYNRRPPLVEYEPPLIEGFKAEYDDDPRTLDENDPRWLSYRARTLTQFHREVREAMDAVAEARGRRIEISAIVMSTEEENLANAMDLKAWVGEGLVDTLIPYTSAPNLDSTAESWADVRDVEYFVELTRGTACKLAPNLMPRERSAADYRRRAAALYAAGIEHFFLWDTDAEQPRSNSAGPWDAARRLGHSEEIEAWIEAGEPDLPPRTAAVRRLGDWDVSYGGPG